MWEILTDTKLKETFRPDGINNKLLKMGGKELYSRIFQVFIAISKQEVMMKEWKTRLIVRVLKKGNS